MITKRDILIISDSRDIHRSITMHLNEYDYALVPVKKSKDGIDYASDNRPAIAIIDLCLRDGHGVDTLRKIGDKSPLTVCIIISGKDTLESAVEAVNSGAFGIILKPLERNNLLTAIQRASEKHKADEKQKFRSQISEQVNDSVIVSDLGYNIVWVNQAFETLYGYSQKEIVGKNPGILNAEPKADEIQAEILKTVSSGRIWNGELINKKRDGTTFPTDLIITPLTDETDQIIAYASFQRDVTVRKMREDALKEEERKYRELADLLPQTVYEIDLDGRITYINQFGLEATGYTHEDVEKGLGAFQIVSKKDHKRLKLNISLAESGVQYVPDEYTIRRKDGTTFTALIYATCIFKDKKSIGLRGILVDKTELKKAEEERLASEIRFRSMIESTSDAVFCYEYNPPIITSDPEESQIEQFFNGILVECNNVCASFYGADSTDEIIGRTFSDLFKNSPQNYSKLFRKLITGNYNLKDSEGTHKLPDGSIKYFMNNAQCVVENDRVLRVWGNFRNITDRKLAEIKLQQTTRMSSDIVQAIPSGLFIFQYEKPNKLTLISGNPESEKLTGIKVNECIGKSLNDILPEAQKFGITDVLLNVARTGETQETSDTYYKDDKLEGSFRNRVFKIPNNRIAVAFEDVTKIKIAEENLQNSEKKFRSYVDNAPDGLIVSNGKGVILDVNKGASVLTGYAINDLLKMSLFDLFTSNDQNDIMTDLKNLNLNETLKIELPFMKNDSTKGFLSLDAVVLNTDKYLIFCKDMTDRKQTEATLIESERRYRQLVENIPFKLSHFDVKQQKYIYWNTDELWTGMSIDEWNSLSPEKHMSFIHPEDIPRVRNAIIDWESSGQKETLKFEYRIRRKERDYSWLESWIYNEFDDAKNHISTIQLYWDITERKKIEQQQKKLADRFQEAQKKESLSLLAGGIAHDFNNLLVGILGNASFILSDLSPASPIKESLIGIEKSAQRAADLTRQMLAYSGKGHFVIEDFSLTELVNEMIHLVKASITKKAKINLELDDEIPAINGDITQIRQLVMNLIINASDAIGEENGSITLKTGVKNCSKRHLRNANLGENLEPGKYIFLCVEDTGCGMAENTLKKIFDPFYTTKFTGRGLGLAATLGIVEGHKGAIIVESALGKGTKFEIVLPISHNKQPVQDTAVQTGSSEHGTGTIFIVDDEELIINLVSRSLKRAGYDVISAKDGLEAVEIYKSRFEEIDLILLDLTMPKLSGEEAFEEIKKINSDAIVVISSGFGEQEAEKRFFGKGLTGFVQKPYTPTSLINKIAQILREH